MSPPELNSGPCARPGDSPQPLPILAAADHLRVPRRHGLFTHHGIDLGDGSVAHYLEGREILRSSLLEFSCGELISVVPYPAASCSTPEVTLRRAIGRIGEQRYNLIFNNCEHFAHWCKTGRHRSAQVEGWLEASQRGPRAMVAALLDQAGIANPRQGAAALLGAIKQLLASQLSEGQLERGRGWALHYLEQLNGLRRQLQEGLESELSKAEARWGEPVDGDSQFVAMRRAAQRLADQLTEVEELESRLEKLLGPGQRQEH